MPSGDPTESGAEGAGAAELQTGRVQEGAELGRAGAVLPAGAAGAGETGGGTRAAEAAMKAAATIGHGGLAAFAAAAGAGAAAGGGQEIPGAVAVLELAAAVGRQAAGCRSRF